MEKLAAVVFAGMLGYICLMLTSINNKIDAMYGSGTQYAVLNEVKPQSFSGNEIQDIALKNDMALPLSASDAGYLLAAAISIFIAWHVSRLYHSHQWTKTILRKSYVHYTQPYRTPAMPEAIHLDQDCVTDEPLPDGRIKRSWLPPHAVALYSGWRA